MVESESNRLTEFPLECGPVTDREFESLYTQFEAAWKLGEVPVIEEYLDQVSSSKQPNLLAGLIEIELWWRRNDSPPPVIDDYLSRFPQAVSAIEKAFREFVDGSRQENLDDSPANACTGKDHDLADTSPPKVSSPDTVSFSTQAYGSIGTPRGPSSVTKVQAEVSSDWAV